MAAVSLVHAPIRALSNPHLPGAEAAACWIHVKGGERESTVEFPPDAPGSSLDNALWIPSDDDDDDDDDSEILGSKALGTPREPLVTPGVFGGPETSPDDLPCQANMDDGAKRDGAVESSPKTQGTSTDAAIVIPEAEEEEDCQLNLVCPPPLESNASGVLGGGLSVSSADRGTPEDPTSTVERDFISGHASQANAQDIQPTSHPNARVESSDPPSVSPQASSDTSVLRRRHEDEDADNGADDADDADTTDRQDTAETSATECDTPVQLPSPPKHKSPPSPCGRTEAAVHRVGNRAQEDRGETMSPHRKLLRRDSDSGEDKPTRVRDEDDEDYNSSHTEAAQPQRKRRKISTRSRRVRERLTSDDSSEGGTAADTVQATYAEWPLQDVLLKRVTEGGRTVFQLQFAWDSRPQHHPKAYGSRTALAQKSGVARAKFTKDEDALLVRLKEDDRLCWPEIHKRFSARFGGRSRGALQVHYSTMLKRGK
ncbi:hypothetical protein DL769_004970 [Monosporascus sp. CRB-8-3]|nr:hypothetical protein DL769_004970 [Monosporascus sp. CRB-8-3]